MSHQLVPDLLHLTNVPKKKLPFDPDDLQCAVFSYIDLDHARLLDAAPGPPPLALKLTGGSKIIDRESLTYNNYTMQTMQSTK